MAYTGNFDATDRPIGENRYPNEVLGSTEWRDLIDHLNDDDFLKKHSFPALDPIVQLDRPRVFISHQQKDKALARRMAFMASQKGFDFWLDILDPNLNRAHNLKLHEQQKALVMAAIIEIALLNCSHLIVILTNQSKSSRWVPYEYGRAKTKAVATSISMTWKSKNYSGYYPEYLLLGAQTQDENQVEKWFGEQRLNFYKIRNKRINYSKGKWKGKVPPHLF